MEKKRVTMKIWQHSLHRLKVLAALEKISMIDLIERLIDAEWERVQQKKEQQ
jgi:hypothetical protein